MRTSGSLCAAFHAAFTMAARTLLGMMEARREPWPRARGQDARRAGWYTTGMGFTPFCPLTSLQAATCQTVRPNGLSWEYKQRADDRAAKASIMSLLTPSASVPFLHRLLDFTPSVLAQTVPYSSDSYLLFLSIFFSFFFCLSPPLSLSLSVLLEPSFRFVSFRFVVRSSFFFFQLSALPFRVLAPPSPWRPRSILFGSALSRSAEESRRFFAP